MNISFPFNKRPSPTTEEMEVTVYVPHNVVAPQMRSAGGGGAERVGSIETFDCHEVPELQFHFEPAIKVVRGCGSCGRKQAERVTIRNV